MASDGFLSPAKRGKCRKCKRYRAVKYVVAVDENLNGYCRGYIWECKDKQECEQIEQRRNRGKHYEIIRDNQN